MCAVLLTQVTGPVTAVAQTTLPAGDCVSSAATQSKSLCPLDPLVVGWHLRIAVDLSVSAVSGLAEQHVGS